MRSSKPPRASVMALSLGTSSSTDISVFCRKTLPLSSTETASGSLSWSRLLAWVWQVDRHANGQKRRRDHENDQQNQHHVDHGGDVDLGHDRPAAVPPFSNHARAAATRC